MPNYERRLAKLEQADAGGETADSAPLVIVWGDGVPPADTPQNARIMRVRWLRPNEETP
jgi:hypothetical protein